MTSPAAGPASGPSGREPRDGVEQSRVSRSEAPTEVVPGDDATARPARGTRAGSASAELVLGRYRLEEQLGAGAFGVVWRAWDERLERDVAVKAIAADAQDGGRGGTGRATREARAAARLAHPAIVTLYEAGAEGGTTYLVSELVRGGTLAQLLHEGALSDRDVAEVGIALCAGLAHAHAQGVVHRDVKPSNVLVPDARSAGAPAAKLTDFGVARVVGGGGDALTRTGDVVGTLAYMAPEQAEGKEAGAPADLYATALVLYEALSGVNPVRAGSAVATARKLGATLPPLHRQRRDLPPALCDSIDRALLPRPKDRGTVARLSRALRASLPELGDEPGIVEAPAIERAATAVTRIAALRPHRRRSRERELAEIADELGALDGWTVEDRRADRAGGAEDARAAAGGGRARARRRQDPPATAPVPLLNGHVLPGVAAGALTALALARLGTSGPPVRPLLAGALAAAIVGLLPRLGWLATAAVLTGWVAGDAGGRGPVASASRSCSPARSSRLRCCCRCAAVPGRCRSPRRCSASRCWPGPTPRSPDRRARCGAAPRSARSASGRSRSPSRSCARRSGTAGRATPAVRPRAPRRGSRPPRTGGSRRGRGPCTTPPRS